MKRLSFALLALLASAALAAAQTIGVTPLTGGSGGGGSVTLATTCPSSSQTGSSLTLTNGANAQAESASYTVLAADCGKVIEASGATTTITLLATITSGYQITIGNVNAPAGANVTVALGGTNTANGVSGSLTLAPGQFIGIFAGSGVSPTNWDVAGAVSASSVGTDPGYVVSQWYVGINLPGDSATGAALSTGTAYCTPQKLMNPVSSGGTGTIGSLAIRVSTIGTSTITEAVYQDAVVGGVHRPKTLLGYTAQAANTSVATLTGALNAGVSVSSGLIWTCATQGDSTGKVSLASGGTGSALAYTGNSSATAQLTNTGDGVTFPVTYGATAALTWPADASGLTYSESTNLTPFVLFQFSSIP